MQRVTQVVGWANLMMAIYFAGWGSSCSRTGWRWAYSLLPAAGCTCSSGGARTSGSETDPAQCGEGPATQPG
jgi:hypothetical protein